MTDQEFPIGDTIGDGTYRVEQHLQGRGLQQLYQGHSSDGAEILVAVDKRSSKSLDAFLREVSYSSRGIFDLAFLGDFDAAGSEQRRFEQGARRAMVERVADGRWLPSILGTHPANVVYESAPRPLPSHEPRTALRNALSLGRTAGAILASAASSGLLLSRVRPEYMWARPGATGLEVTGLSARADAFFAQSRVDAVALPLFDRYYYAPETQGDGAIDDRALVFPLAIMIAEWATGCYPYATKYHPNGALSGHHVPLAVPAVLAKLLSRGMHIERDERPRLATFLSELDSAA